MNDLQLWISPTLCYLFNLHHFFALCLLLVAQPLSHHALFLLSHPFHLSTMFGFARYWYYMYSSEICSFRNSHLWSVFDFYAGPSVRGRQLYCRACNLKKVSVLLAGNFYTSYIEPNRLLLLRDTGTTRFYSKDIHLVIFSYDPNQH